MCVVCFPPLRSFSHDASAAVSSSQINPQAALLQEVKLNIEHVWKENRAMGAILLLVSDEHCLIYTYQLKSNISVIKLLSVHVFALFCSRQSPICSYVRLLLVFLTHFINYFKKKDTAQQLVTKYQTTI